MVVCSIIKNSSFLIEQSVFDETIINIWRQFQQVLLLIGLQDVSFTDCTWKEPAGT